MRRLVLLILAVVVLGTVLIGGVDALMDLRDSQREDARRSPLSGEVPADAGMRSPAGGDHQIPPAAQRPRPVGPVAPVADAAPVPDQTSPVRDQTSPGADQLRDLRRRIGTAAGVGRRAREGDPEAVAEVARRMAAEPDPRVRQALTSGEMPDLGRFRWAPPVLPEPVSPAEPGEVKAYWLTPDSHGGTYESTVSVDATGRAGVDTVYESDDGQHWHVRYQAWAFRDAQGRLVLDARGQEVEYLQRPAWGWWSPDSMIIGKDGLIDMIDDKHDPGQGTSGAKGPG